MLLPRSATAAVLLAGLALSGLVAGAGGARAATAPVTITLTATGAFSPGVPFGRSVDFKNSSGIQRTVLSTSSNWSYATTVGQGQTSPASAALTKAGSYTFSVSGIVGGAGGFSGSFSVAAGPAPTSSPTPVAAPSAGASGSATPRPTSSPAPRPTATRAAGAPAASGGARPGSGQGATQLGGTGSVAGPPIAGFTGGSLPGMPPALPAVPAPAIAGAPPLTPLTPLSPLSPVPTAAGGSPLAAGPQARPGVLAQSSPHRYGLPATLAVVAVAGVGSLLVRLLLARPAAVRRRARTRSLIPASQ